VTLFSHVLAMDPRGSFPNLSLWTNLHLRYHSPLARKYFERAQFFKAAGSSGSAYREYCALQERDSLEAGRRLDRVISIAPDRNELYKNLAEWSLLSRSPAGAELYSRRLLAVAPENVYARLCFVQALLEQNKLADAEQEYRKVLDKDAGNAEAHRMLGVILAARGDREGARLHYRRVLELDPGNEEAKKNLDELDNRPPERP
jgi:Flp pilus assembly protein TadD